jgi:uncharacterized protein YjbJ (UPF0337 family)
MAGETDKVKGRVKQAAGDLTDDQDMKDEGKLDEAAGKAKNAAGKAKEKVEDTIDAARRKLS